MGINNLSKPKEIHYIQSANIVRELVHELTQINTKRKKVEKVEKV